jgi:hypothetical protein
VSGFGVDLLWDGFRVEAVEERGGDRSWSHWDSRKGLWVGRRVLSCLQLERLSLSCRVGESMSSWSQSWCCCEFLLLWFWQ